MSAPSDIIAANDDFTITHEGGLFYIEHRASGWSHGLGAQPPWASLPIEVPYTGKNVAAEWLEVQGTDKIMAVYFPQVGQGDRARATLRDRIQRSGTLYYAHDRNGLRRNSYLMVFIVDNNHLVNILPELGALDVARVKASRDGIPSIQMGMSVLHDTILGKLGLEGERITAELITPLHRGRKL